MRMSLRRFLPTSRQRSAGADASNKVPAKSLAVRKAFWRRSNRIGGVHLTSAGHPSVVCLCERRRISQTLTSFHDAVRSPVQNGAAVRAALRAAAALCSLPWNFRNRHDRICDRRTVAGYRGKPRGQRFIDRIARQRLCARRRRWRPSGCRHHNVAVTSAKVSRSEVQNSGVDLFARPRRVRPFVGLTKRCRPLKLFGPVPFQRAQNSPAPSGFDRARSILRQRG